MPTPFQGLRTLGYMVSDITAAKNWYRDILGIEPYFDQPFYVGFNVGGYELGLAHTENVQPATGNAITYWGVVNVQETYDMLLSKGATEYEKPTDVGEGIIVAGVKDPWGNLFGVICNPHFKLP